MESATSAAESSTSDGALDLETEWRELDALAVVDTIRTDKVLDRSRGTELDRVICTRCGVEHPIQRATCDSRLSSATKARC